MMIDGVFLLGLVMFISTVLVVYSLHLFFTYRVLHLLVFYSLLYKRLIFVFITLVLNNLKLRELIEILK